MSANIPRQLERAEARTTQLKETSAGALFAVVGKYCHQTATVILKWIEGWVLAIILRGMYFQLVTPALPIDSAFRIQFVKADLTQPRIRKDVK
jgi:hypothetical protein